MAIAIFDKVSMDDKIRHLKNEKIIRDGKDTFVKVGLALEDIRDSKTYRDTHETFEAYCQEKWGFKRGYAYQMIQAAEAVQGLSPKCTALLNSPKAAVELAQVPKDKREAVVREAKKGGKKVTAEAIKEAAKVVVPPPAVNYYEDELGVPIPSKILETWFRGDEIEQMLKQVRNIKSVVSKGIKENDPLFKELTNTAIADISHVIAVLEMAYPYTVCTACNGQLLDDCVLCHGRGFLSKQRYMTVPEEIREMREKVIRKGTK